MFDPLHKWLGIPPEHQPPNHYRLLGIDPFESDPDVIDMAADRQLTFLHELSGDEHQEAAETISNQVSMARLCLLNAEKKSNYDQALAKSLEVPTSPSVQESVSVIPTPLNTTSIPSRSSTRSSRSSSRSARSSSRRRSPWATISAVIGIVVLLMLGLAIQQGHLGLDLSWFSSVKSRETQVKAAKPQRLGPTSSPATTGTGTSTPSQQTSDLPRRAVANQEIASPQSSQTDAVPPTQSVNAPTGDINSERSDDLPGNPNADMGSAQPSPNQPSPNQPIPNRPSPKPRRSLADLLHQVNPATVATASPSGQAASPSAGEDVDSSVQNDLADGQKAPYPSESALAEKLSLIRDLYQQQYLSAKTSQQRIELARQMHRDGEQTSNDPVGRFALWKVSRDIFTGQGRYADAMAIADNMAMFYQSVDAQQWKLDSLRDASGKLRSSDLDSYYEAVITFANRCIDQKRYAPASDAISFLLQTFRDRLSESQRNDALRLSGQVVRDGKQYQEFVDAINQLVEGTSSDPAKSNRFVGEYLALVRSDWDEAVFYLAKSDLKPLAKAGELGLAYQTQQATAIQVADAWYDAAKLYDEQPASQQQKLQVLRRAKSFYEIVSTGEKGLAQRKAAMRVEKINEVIGDEIQEIDPMGDDLMGDDLGRSGLSGDAIAYRIYHSRNSKSDYARRRRNEFTIGMGRRSAGFGEAAVGIELRSVRAIKLVRTASPEEMLVMDAFSKTGLVIDYHTPGGYAKRVFLGFDIEPGRTFTDEPMWGTGGKPDVVTDIGKSSEYEIDLTRFAPPTWDGRSWVTLYMQNAGEGREIQAAVTW
jgi:tetratricopeptide (TPR) repeat protein